MFNKCKYQSNLFKIAKEINATDTITKIVAFQPPKNPQYSIEPFNLKHCCIKRKQKHCCRYKKVKFVHEAYTNILYPWLQENCYTFKKSNRNQKKKDKNIVILHIKNKNKPMGGITILFSHGNASTLGTIYSELIDLSTQLKCDIIAYDYSGYGRSEGKPSEKEIYSDIEDVGYFVQSILNIPAKEIILLGHSLGSAPSVHLAITHNFRDIKAIILISPIASGVRLVSPDIKIQDLEKIDVFSNIKKIIDVSSPIFLIHGQKDEVIPIQQSLEMAKFMKNPYEWHPRNGDHHNILTKYRTKFFQKFKFFLEILNYYSQKQITNNSITTYNCNLNDKYYYEVMKFKDDDRNNLPFLFNENYMKNSQNFIILGEGYDKDGCNGHAFSAKEHPKTFQDFEKLPEKREENNFKDSRGKKFCDRIHNPHNSQIKDYPFDMVSEDIECRDSIVNRNSNGSDVVCYNGNKELENQFNMMLMKHNGI